ncbi:hypothetical protein [Bacteroides thetaiotaomicron]|uniref:hypothetical protein n=1 Tax=Bacteroides thetaiotaomicron TaxID=818 RepID=UPI001F5B7FB5|nr:hypothetical protein [Bacteroides thetaiotaomicron]
MKMKSKTKSCCQYTQWVVLAYLHLSLQVAKIMMTQQEILIRISLLSFLNSVQKKEDLEPECSCMEKTSEVIFQNKVTIGGQDSKVVGAKGKSSTVLCQLKLMMEILN